MVYEFSCASCSSSYIGKNCRHFKSMIEEHIKKDNKPYIFKHLHSTAICFDSYSSLCFKIINEGNSKVDLKIKEDLHINWRNLKCTHKSFSPHLLTITSLPLALFCLCLFVCFFVFLFHLLFSLSLALITGIFYCLNYTLPLLHLITTHLASHLSLSCIVFIISKLIIGIFYCHNYTSLLLHLILTHLVIDFIKLCN